jgi:hypothetical protein
MDNMEERQVEKWKDMDNNSTDFSAIISTSFSIQPTFLP